LPILSFFIVLRYQYDSFYQITIAMPKSKIQLDTIKSDRDIAHVYGILKRPDRALFRERMENKHGIPQPTIFRYLRTNEIPVIKRNVMVDELNTILKLLGYYYDGKQQPTK